MQEFLTNFKTQYMQSFVFESIPEVIINQEISDEKLHKSLGVFIDLEIEEIDYYLANLILLESDYYSDEAILYFLPKFIELLIDNEGHIHSIYTRLEILNPSKLNLEQKKFINYLIDELKRIEIIFHKSGNDEVIAFL